MAGASTRSEPAGKGSISHPPWSKDALHRAPVGGRGEHAVGSVDAAERSRRHGGKVRFASECGVGLLVPHVIALVLLEHEVGDAVGDRELPPRGGAGEHPPDQVDVHQDVVKGPEEGRIGRRLLGKGGGEGFQAQVVRALHQRRPVQHRQHAPDEGHLPPLAAERSRRPRGRRGGGEGRVVDTDFGCGDLQGESALPGVAGVVPEGVVREEPHGLAVRLAIGWDAVGAGRGRNEGRDEQYIYVLLLFRFMYFVHTPRVGFVTSRHLWCSWLVQQHPAEALISVLFIYLWMVGEAGLARGARGLKCG